MGWMALPANIDIIQDIGFAAMQMFFEIEINNKNIQITVDTKWNKPQYFAGSKSKKSFKQRHKRYPT